MSMMHKLWKLLLKKEFYEKHKDNLPVASFDEIGQDLLDTLIIAHNAAKADLTEDELYLIHTSQNPTLTTANKNTVHAYLENIKSASAVSMEIADAVFNALWKQEIGRYISQYGINLTEGKLQDTEGLHNYLGNVGKSFIPDDLIEPVDTDPIKLFTRLKEQGKWHINIPILDKKIGKVSPGMFIILLARPESGKTATIVNLIAGREGFAAQGANVHLIANEEGAERTAGRAACCYNQVSIGAVMLDPSIAKTTGWEEVRKRLTFVHKPDITMSQLENYIKVNKPDVVVIDQLDHLSTTSTFDSNTDRLSVVYRKARELSSKYNCVIIGVSQASAEGENKSKITFSMAENSKTGKAATADLIIGLGKVDDSSIEEDNCVIRHYHVSKNKLSGWHGTAVVKLIQDESRIIP